MAFTAVSHILADGPPSKNRPKKPVYLGCEGKSEVAYGQLINDLLDTCGLAFLSELTG